MKMVIRVSALAASIVVAMSLSPAASAAGRSDLVLQGLDGGRPFVPGDLLVQFDPRATAAEREAVRRGLGARQQEVVSQAGGPLELLSLPPGLAVRDAVLGLEGVEGVVFAEPNWVYSHQAVSNDAYYTNGSLWGMYGDATSPANQYGSQAGEAWARGRTDCSSVWVGVIDEGYMYAHEDLAANAGVNPGEVAGNGADDDGNGYVDDVHGWDFDRGDNTVFDGTQDDHGTHVSGTIGGVGGNGLGVAGVCWSVKLINAKFLGRAGGTTANAVKAVDYLTDLKTRHGLNLVATNNSWGGGGFSSALQDAIGRAGAADILFIAAAGNSGDDNDATPSYPSGYPNDNVIAVAALTSSGAMAGYSQYGATTVDICAPGSGVVSTVPKNVKGKLTAAYASYSGTSMATPHVSGAAALYAANHAGAGAAAIKAAILGSSVATASCNGKVVSNGRLDVSGF
jgi:subtilisin family serine protease